MQTPIILDTDIAYDPDDLFALLFLKELAGDRLKLLVTANEVEGKRAQFARMVLDQIGLDAVPVVQGESLGMSKFTANDLMPDRHYDIHSNYVEQMKKIVDEHESVTYIGIGGFTNLAHFLRKHPDAARKMDIVVMGGAVNYKRKPEWVEYNVKIDMDSARFVINSHCGAKYVMAQTTHNPLYEVNSKHPFYRKLSESAKPGHQLLYRHCKEWFDIRGHGTSMHDPLTVATALGYDFVTFNRSDVVLDDTGTIAVDKQGAEILWSDPVSRAQECMDFIDSTLFGEAQ